MVNEFSKKFDMDPLWNKIMLRKHFVIECINNMLKNTAKLVYSRHSPINNFLMNLVAALVAYCFYKVVLGRFSAYCYLCLNSGLSR